MTATAREAVRRFLAEKREAQTRFLAQLVQTPSDNPPGDCRAHAERAASLLAELGLHAEKHPVPEAEARAHGMVSITNLILRRRIADAPSGAVPGPLVSPRRHSRGHARR